MESTYKPEHAPVGPSPIACYPLAVILEDEA